MADAKSGTGPAIRPENSDLDADYKAVARVSKHVDLDDLRLVTLHAESNAPPNKLPADWAEQAFVGINAHLHSSGDDKAEEQTGRFCVHAGFLVVFKQGAERLDEPPEYDADNPPELVIEAVFELDYAVGEEASLARSDLDEFVRINCPFQAWPYWREVAQSACQRMGIYNPLVVPSLRLPSPHDSQE